MFNVIIRNRKKVIQKVKVWGHNLKHDRMNHMSITYKLTNQTWVLSSVKWTWIIKKLASDYCKIV